jgi:hypothetical protein
VQLIGLAEILRFVTPAILNRRLQRGTPQHDYSIYITFIHFQDNWAASVFLQYLVAKTEMLCG